jgi:hypothetical protein
MYRGNAVGLSESWKPWTLWYLLTFIMFLSSVVPRCRCYGNPINPDFAFKMRKNLIRSNPSSCSLLKMLIFPVLQGCEMMDLNGPIKNNSMIIISLCLRPLELY